MAKRATFMKALDAALRQGPCDAVTLAERMKAAGWRPMMSDWWSGGAYVPPPMGRRMVWRCRRGHAAALFVKGRNVYFHPDRVGPVADRFDLQDATARLVAADWASDQGDDVLADHLRRCKRLAFRGG